MSNNLEGSIGESLTKEQVKNLVDMASLMYAWASESGNVSVKAQTNLSPSNINRLKDSQLPGRAQALHSLATENKAAAHWRRAPALCHIVTFLQMA